MLNYLVGSPSTLFSITKRHTVIKLNYLVGSPAYAQSRANSVFHAILTGKFISSVILLIQGHLQGQKVNCKVKLGTNVIHPFDVILTT